MAVTLDMHAADFEPRFRALLAAKREASVDVDAAVAAMKLNDAETVEDACAWLKPKERVAVLADRALIAMLVRLPFAEEPGQGRQSA